jgi:hypothetical protein
MVENQQSDASNPARRKFRVATGTTAAAIFTAAGLPITLIAVRRPNFF